MRNYLERYGYIAVTILSSMVTFVKSYLFMDLLSKEELGYVALFQSVILIVNFFQMGVIYGGYRVISFSVSRQEKTNNAVMSYLFLLFTFGLGASIILNFFIPLNWFWIIGLLVGVLSLWANWVSNMHMAMARTNKLSIITLSSIVMSFSALPLLYIHPLFGAVALIGLQPFFLILFSYLFNKDFRFRISLKDRIYLKLIVKLGFVPFVTGILHYLNLQLERWVISFDLGVAALGEYYLVFVYVSLFAVIPGALGTLNFPRFMKSLSQRTGTKQHLIDVFKVYYLEVLAYLLMMLFGTYYIMPWLIKAILPLHETGIKYVQIIFTGLVLFTLIDPISFIINAKLHYKELVYIYLFALIFSILSYSFLYFNQLGSLENYSYVNVLFYVSISLGYIVYYFTKGRNSYNSKTR